MDNSYKDYRRNNTLIAAGKKIDVGRLLIILKSSNNEEVFDKNLKIVAASFFLNIRAKISSPDIFLCSRINNNTAS